MPVGCNCLDSFRRHLKTHYFQQAFLTSQSIPLAPQVQLLSTTFTYFLTDLRTYMHLNKEFEEDKAVATNVDITQVRYIFFTAISSTEDFA